MASPRHRFVLTGGPGVGKSKLLDALKECGFAVFPEVARSILQRPGGMALREHDPAGFASAMLAAESKAWQDARPGVSAYDRGFPDIAGFLELERVSASAEVDTACRELRYSGPIFRLPPWQAIYATDAERIQSWDQALASDAAVSSAWQHYGYSLIDVPLTTVADRVGFVREHLSAQLASRI